MAGFDASGQFDMTNFADTDTDRTAVEMSPHHATAGGESQPGGETRQPTEKEGEAAAEAVVSGMKENDSTSNGLSPCEARVAGVYHEHGCVSSVHGLASIMHPSSRNRHTENMSKLSQRGRRGDCRVQGPAYQQRGVAEAKGDEDVQAAEGDDGP